MRIRRCPGRVRSTATTGKAATTRTEGTAPRTALQGRVHRPTDVDPVKRAVPERLRTAAGWTATVPGLGRNHLHGRMASSRRRQVNRHGYDPLGPLLTT